MANVNIQGNRLRRIAIHSALLVLLIAGGLGLPELVAPGVSGVVQVAVAAGEECPDPQERAFLKKINRYRKRNGLKPLVLSTSLMLAAHKHSQDMSQMRRVNGHNLLGGVTTKQNLINHGYPAQRAAWGENLAFGTGWSSGKKAFNVWRRSPGHNKNMVRKQFRAIGIARVHDPNSTYKWYWTTTFGSVIGARPHC